MIFHLQFQFQYHLSDHGSLWPDQIELGQHVSYLFYIIDLLISRSGASDTTMS